MNTLPAGASYLIRGMRLLLQPGLKRFVWVPLLANSLLFILLTSLLYQQYGLINAWFQGVLPVWSWLTAFFSGLFIMLVIIAYGFSFSLITNIIGAPFYGLLAEKIESQITAKHFPQETLLRLVLRTLKRELQKLGYFISRGLVVSLGLLILSFFPLINLAVPLLAMLWGAWVMSLQYVDYPADNNHLSFKALRHKLAQQRFAAIGFGGAVMLLSMTPLFNIFLMPIAVAGGTLLWIESLSTENVILHE
ncbi:MAG: sulfate transporter CysZ [Cellvibrionaceae bacterium]|nr:sulfate transporter CysZ [Cellvibrionaceae bacterium]